MVSAADLAKLDRAIKKEPAYKGKPAYCLLVFGSEAKSRCWLVLDGDTLYVDRNCNGDLTEKGEQVGMLRFEKPEGTEAVAAFREVKAGDITDGRFQHTGLEIGQARLAPAFTPTDQNEEALLRLARSNPGGFLYGVSLSVELCSGQGRVRFSAQADTQGFLHFADSPGTAPVIHFDGPLQMALQPSQELVRGDKPTELHCWVGTPGLGKGTFASLVYATKPGLVPAKCHPVAEVSFPSKKPLTAKVLLDQRC
jgi:hypothetical protein